MRKIALINDGYYHIFSRSIAGFKIFNTSEDFERFIECMQFYRVNTPGISYSYLLKQSDKFKNKLFQNISEDKQNHSISIISYCIMPTHFHLVLRQNRDNGVTNYISNLLNSYSRYFNIKHKRKGPLWEGRFKNVLIENDDVLLHITRYIHLNPSSAGLVENPENWKYSSFGEYIGARQNTICDYQDVLQINPREYKRFVNDRKDYQKEISKIKAHLIDNYTG